MKIPKQWGPSLPGHCSSFVLLIHETSLLRLLLTLLNFSAGFNIIIVLLSPLLQLLMVKMLLS